MENWDAELLTHSTNGAGDVCFLEALDLKLLTDVDEQLALFSQLRSNRIRAQAQLKNVEELLQIALESTFMCMSASIP